MLPNPPPDLSQLPESVLDLRVKLQNIQSSLTKEEFQAIDGFQKVANYMAAAMIYLRKNPLLKSPLQKDDLKPRLLGHWGTCPGLTLVYAHLNLAIKRNDLDMLMIVGPGHGAPAVLACLWLEDSYARYYPEIARTESGFAQLVEGFSTPKGFPSHVSASVPGSIHEGGELGYALSVAFGAVMDNPDLIVACVVGDGEAETGPTAAAWHGYKYIDPAESGAVLPILHCNGFKISERTIFGTMDDREITALFTGYGYQVCIVEDLANLDHEMAAAMQWAVDEIRAIQKAARSGQPLVKPRWPMIVLRTPKGMSGPKALAGIPIEGTYKSHQVPLASPASSPEQFELLKVWLESYGPSTIFGPNSKLLELIDKYIIPSDHSKRMGQRKETNDSYHPIDLPDWMAFAHEKGGEASETRLVGKYMAEVFKRNPTTTRLWSPDELTSNKLDSTFEVTGRNFQWDPESRAQGGRIIEILSEHTCQGMMQGYTLTGRTGLFPSYESFLGIVQTMMVQYSKFIKMARELPWRNDVACFNYLETSTWTRQEHNGFSHQNPAFIGGVLNLKAKQARVYLPPDANCMLSTIAHCMGAKNYINLIIGSKHDTPVWLSPEEAAVHCKKGASMWKFASTHNGENPDVVLASIGVEVTFEVIAAIAMLREIVPELRIRMVNITDLMVLGAYGTHPHAMSDEDFDALFTHDRHVHFNYHSYPIELKGLLFGRPNLDRVTIEGYQEEGTTTTPFAMMVLNHVSRYDVAKFALEAGRKFNPAVDGVADELIEHLDKELEGFWKYIKETGKDPDGMFNKPKLAE